MFSNIFSMLARLGNLESKTFGICKLKKEFIFVTQILKSIEIKFEKHKERFKNYIVKAGCLRICFLRFIARVQFCN